KLLAPLLELFFGGWLLACLLEPLVAQFMRHSHARRSTAVVATYLTMLVAVVLVWIGVAPVAAGQITTSVTNLPAQVDEAAQRTMVGQTIANAWLANHGMTIQLDL